MKDNKDEQFPVVDEMGNIVGAISRGHAHDGSKILHPVVHLHLFNNKGDLFLQHRPAWKDIQPDKWDTACGYLYGSNTCLEKKKKELQNTNEGSFTNQ